MLQAMTPKILNGGKPTGLEHSQSSPITHDEDEVPRWPLRQPSVPSE